MSADYFVDDGFDAAELGQCPFDVGTEDWREWQQRFIDRQRRHDGGEDAANGRIAAVTGGKITFGPGAFAPNALDPDAKPAWLQAAMADLQKTLQADLAKQLWVSTDPAEAGPITYEALIETFGILSINHRKHIARLIDLDTT